MVNTKETGHAKNVALFSKSVGYVRAYGKKYDPILPRIKVDALTDTLGLAKSSLKDVKSNKQAWNNATNIREIAFKDFKELSSRVMSALKATDATEQTLADAQTSFRKTRGARAKPVTPPVATEGATTDPVKKTKSVSQQGYDNMVEHYEELINTVAAEPSYAPNENELQVQSLRAELEVLRAKNDAAADAETALDNARILRDSILYGPETGIADVIYSLKRYVSSIYGKSSPQLKQLTSLPFVRR